MKILAKGEYYGNKRLELDNRGIVLSEYYYHSQQTDWHYHENPYFMYVMEGDVYDINKKGKTNCSAGSLLLHNWNETHQNTKESSTARGFHIEFEQDWFVQNKLDVSLWEGSQKIENPIMHNFLAKLYYEFRLQDDYSGISIDLLLLQICENTQKKISSDLKYEPSWVTPLKELLYESEVDQISLQWLSVELGVHPVHLSRAIPKYLSTNLGDYIRQLKIKKALAHMFDPKYSLTEIAHLSGFSDQSHFIRTFKLYFGQTPKEFRLHLA